MKFPYSKSIYRKISREKMHGQSLKKIWFELPRVLFHWIYYRRHLIPSAVSYDSCVKCCLPGKFMRDGVPKIFIGAEAYQILKFQVPWRKVSIPHKSCILHKHFTLNHTYQLGNDGNPSEIQVTTC